MSRVEKRSFRRGTLHPSTTIFGSVFLVAHTTFELGLWHGSFCLDGSAVQAEVEIEVVFVSVLGEVHVGRNISIMFLPVDLDVVEIAGLAIDGDDACGLALDAFCHGSSFF